MPAAPASLQSMLTEVKALAQRLKRPSIGDPGQQPASSGAAMLRILFEDGLQTVPQIARKLGTSRQNIQILVNRLKAARCLELRPNPAHKRSELVCLTEPGKTLLFANADCEKRVLATLIPHISEA